MQLSFSLKVGVNLIYVFLSDLPVVTRVFLSLGLEVE